MKNQELKPQYPQLRQTSKEVARQMGVNWSKYERPEWQEQFSKLILATFLNTHPDTVLKACSHVLLTNSDEYPPSQGRLIQQMRDYIGTGQARSPQLKACSMCSDGLRKISFWIRENNQPKYIEVNTSCAECERGAKRKSSLKMLSNIDFLLKLLNKEIYSYPKDGEYETKMISGQVTIKIRYRGEDKVKTIERDYWLQTKTDEQPPLEMICRDLNQSKHVSDFGELARERKQAKAKYLEALKFQERHLLEKDQKEIVQTFDNLQSKEELKIHEYCMIKAKIQHLKESIEYRETMDEIKDITLEEYITIQKARKKGYNDV